MKRIKLDVQSCNDCPKITPTYMDDGVLEFSCRHTNPWRHVWHTNEIPAWCPLEDVKEEEEK